MQIDFLEARDGSKTFSVNGVFYHSSYSPAKEAQRFIETTEFLFNPKYIFFVEPGLNYCASFLKKRFSDCKIVCIRLFDKTFEDEKSWDYIIRYNPTQNFSQILLQTFGEEALLSSTILIWKPAETLFSEKLKLVVSDYKTALENSKTLLVTRQFFEKKWLINSCNFIKNVKTLINQQIKTELPVVVCASGPSLEPCINLIKNYRNNIFVLCLSSALSVLINNSIIPDLILSTDGGYWAGEHLKLLKKHRELPVAIPCEAFVPKKVLKNNPVFALGYNDQSSFISNKILKTAEIPNFEALRNPTVSGTALFLAKSITSNKIFFCGLDLAESQGFQHSQPNELERNNELNDTRIKPKESRISRSRYNSTSLQIYRDWFSNLDNNIVENTYRVIENSKQNCLGNIKDINTQIFEAEIQSKTCQKVKYNFEKTSYDIKDHPDTFDKIITKIETPEWKHQIFPADYITIQNSTNENTARDLEERLNNKTAKLIQKIRKIADE